MLLVRGDYPAAKQQNEQSKLEEFLSLARIQRPPHGSMLYIVSVLFNMSIQLFYI